MDKLSSMSPRRKLFIAVFFMAVVLGGPSLIKYGLYEIPGHASRLRAAVGTRVHLPIEYVDTQSHAGSFSGVLTYVGYRWNDKWGFFDLEVRVEGDGSTSTGVSPSKASEIVVLDGT